MEDSDEDADVIDIVKNIKIRDENIIRFRKDFPQFKSLTYNQILLIFKMFK